MLVPNESLPSVVLGTTYGWKRQAKSFRTPTVRLCGSTPTCPGTVGRHRWQLFLAQGTAAALHPALVWNLESSHVVQAGLILW